MVTGRLVEESDRDSVALDGGDVDVVCAVPISWFTDS